MTRAMEHCDDMIMEHGDDKNSGALLRQVPWSIVMASVMEHCNDKNSVAF